MKTCIIIPAFNESKAIGKLISDLKVLGLPVLVIDDGSTDQTAKIAQAAQAEVLINEINKGKGASLNRGFKYALENGFDAVIIMDGDGQHLSSDIAAFIELAQASDAGIIVGNRMNRSGNMPKLRFFTNRFMSWLISSICRQDIPDSQCGFRLIKRAVLEKVTFKTNKFEIESETLIRAARAGFKIASVGITTVYRDEKSKINPFIDTLRFIKFIFRIWILQG